MRLRSPEQLQQLQPIQLHNAQSIKKTAHSLALVLWWSLLSDRRTDGIQEDTQRTQISSRSETDGEEAERQAISTKTQTVTAPADTEARTQLTFLKEMILRTRDRNL